MSETDVRIIFLGGGSREQEDSSFRSAVKLRLANQFLADALFLMRDAHRKIREVSNIDKIGEAAGDPNEQIAIPRGDNEIGVFEHGGESRAIPNGTAGAECGGFVEVNGLIEVEVISGAVLDHELVCFGAKGGHGARALNFPQQAQSRGADSFR